MPAASRGRPAAVVILPSSAGVRDEREIYYAEALRDAGIAALVVDSYRSRNLRHSLRGQSLLGSWEISNDAMFRFRTWRTDLIG
jgi:dienelactone hydrolase